MPITIKGTSASPGIKIGKAHIYMGSNIVIPKYKINKKDIDNELKRFEAALEKTKKEINAIQSQISDNLSKDMANIFSSHLMVLEDPMIADQAREKVKDELRNIEWVLNDISVELINSFSAIEDEYLKEKIIDLSDIHKRLINNLLMNDSSDISRLDKEAIIFAPDLTPSDTAIMNKKYVLAFVTDKGGRTSHTAIMARALEIPAVVGTFTGTSKVRNGDTVIVDASHGKVIIQPSEKEIEYYKKIESEYLNVEKLLSELTHLPSKTLDDSEIVILGNIELPEEMELIKGHGAQGIGLFRSEFLFLDKKLPDEERQFVEYKNVVECFNPKPVTIRTLDIGGDKIYAYRTQYTERNPFLGCRAIRFCMENLDLFRTQIRAILRVSHYGNVKMMFPMITTSEEIIKARSIVDEIKNDLRNEKIPFDNNIQIGIMIEVPSAALNSDQLSKYCDFFSVGTNDLVQYLLAVDRISESVAYLYNPLNITVLRILKLIVENAVKNSTPLSICGEIAGEPLYTMLLMGLGYRTFSMSSTLMHQIKRIIRSVSIKECEELAEDLFKLETTEAIEKKLLSTMKKKFPKTFV
ncbi:MAG: phosphoenolpyruvate--protein phosphotransferase [Spirochaetes bacterium]|nr:phosphoenolpyruvate--protein phosphotransferase [Spirochaetota bacterium]